jgi:hypothetical protein
MDSSNFAKSELMTETTAIVCEHVFNAERDIKVVIRHRDGVWQLVCGEHDHPEDCGNFEVVGLEHLIERQPNLIEVADLGRGRLAEQGVDGWTLVAHDD